jgi:hypothetical protein
MYFDNNNNNSNSNNNNSSFRNNNTDFFFNNENRPSQYNFNLNNENNFPLNQQSGNATSSFSSSYSSSSSSSLTPSYVSSPLSTSTPSNILTPSTVNFYSPSLSLNQQPGSLFNDSFSSPALNLPPLLQPPNSNPFQRSLISNTSTSLAISSFSSSTPLFPSHFRIRLHVAPLLQQSIESLKMHLRMAIDITTVLNEQRHIKFDSKTLMKKDKVEFRNKNKKNKKIPLDLRENPNNSYFPYLSSSSLFIPFDWNRMEERPFVPISNAISSLHSDSDSLNSVDEIKMSDLDGNSFSQVAVSNPPPQKHMHLENSGLTPLLSMINVNSSGNIQSPPLEINENLDSEVNMNVENVNEVNSDSSNHTSSSFFEYYEPLSSKSRSLVRHCLYRIVTYLRFVLFI